MITCDINNEVTSCHKELQWPTATKRGLYELKYVVAYGHNKLYLTQIAKFRLGIQETRYIVFERSLAIILIAP